MNSSIIYSIDKSKKEKIYNVTVTSIFTSLSIVISFVCKFFILPFASWLNVDVSIFTQVVIYILIKSKWSILYSIFSILLTSISSLMWYGTGDLIGVFISFVSGALYLLIYYLCSNFIKIKNTKLYIVTCLVISFVAITLLLTILNGILFTPMYWSFLGYGSINFIESARIYNMNPNIYLLNMPTYWSGIFTLYVSFNSIKFFTSSVIIFLILLIISNKINIRKNSKKRYKIIYI